MEVQNKATEWLWTYNNDRPNIAIGGITAVMKLKQAAQFYKLILLKMENGYILTKLQNCPNK